MSNINVKKIILSKEYFKSALILSAVFLGIYFAILIMHYELNISRDQSALLHNESSNVTLLNEIIESELQQLVADTALLEDTIKGYAFDNIKADFKNHNLLAQFLSLSKLKRVYDQIRIIAPDGQEIIRVNYDQGNPYLVPKKALQNKQNRYYFQTIVKLPPGQLYFSPLDLNVETGKIENPQKPTIRIGTPLYNHQKILQGILVLNYDASHLLNRFIGSADKIGEHISLVAPDGFWVTSPRNKKQWQILTEQQQSFTQLHVGAWQSINDQASGQFNTEQGLYTFNTLQQKHFQINEHGNTLIDEQKYLWKVVSFLDSQMLMQPRIDFANRNASFYIFLLIVLLSSSLFISFLRVRHRIMMASNHYEKQFRNTLENIQLAALTIDLDYQISFCNSFFVELTGFYEKEIMQRNCMELLKTDIDKNLIKDEFNKILSGSLPKEQIEFWIKVKSGTAKLLKWTITPAIDANQVVFGLTLIGEDITKRSAEQAQMIKLKQAVEQSPNTVMITSVNGDIEYTNPKFTELTGYHAHEVLGKKPSVLSSGETSQDEYARLWLAIENDQNWQGVFHNKKKNGELYWESAEISAIKNNQGDITNYLAIKQDITERKSLELRVRTQAAQLTKNNELAAVGKMANMIAHDIRNPLSTVKMSLGMLTNCQGCDNNNNETELIKISLEQVHYVEQLLSDLLSYSRPDALSAKWCDINQLLDTSITTLTKAINERSAQVITRFEKGLPTIYVDPVQLRRVFTCVIQNALQASDTVTDRDCEVTISTNLALRESGTMVEIEITDNGCGIDENTRHRLFDPFFTTRAKGTGLGLAIVDRIIKQHNGSINITDREIVGTKLQISLLTTQPQVDNESCHES